MQASKIILGNRYAVKWNGTLSTLIAVALLTTRTKQDTYNRVRGYIEGAPLVKDKTGFEQAQMVEYKVEDILGPYEQHKALVEEREAREAKRDAEKQAEQAKLTNLVDLLYAVTGLPKPADPTKESYKHAFRTGYRSVAVEWEGITPLTNALLSYLGRNTNI